MSRLPAVFGVVALALGPGCDGLLFSPRVSAPESGSVRFGPAQPALPFGHPDVVVPAVDAGMPGRPGAGRRLTLAQLKSSLPVVLGGETWQVPLATPTNGFDVRAATLGAPDYTTVVDENLEASPLYLKFMMDMALDACARVSQADAAKPDPAARVLQRFVSLTDTLASNPAAVRANLRYLALAFHGVKVAEGDTAAVEPLAQLFARAVDGARGTSPATAGHVTEGWRTVCVALLTSPDFHFY